MLTVFELAIGLVVIVGVARYIIRGYSATGVLFVGGLALLIASAIMGHQVLPTGTKGSGYLTIDIVEYIKILLMSRGGDLGMMIMMLCGFAAYMTHIGANDMVVKLASKPLRYINSPYILMIAAYFVACLMSLAVSSATGLGRAVNGDAVPGHGQYGHQSWCRRCYLRLTRRHYSGADIR